MTYRVTDVRPIRPRAMPVALAAVAALLGPGSIESAVATDSSTCMTCALETRVSHLDSLIGDDPTRGRLEKRLEDKPWIAQDWASMLVAVKPADQSLDVAASLQHLGSFEARRLQQRIDEAKSFAKDLVLPKPAAPPPSAFDVWSKVEVSGIDTATGETRRGTVGADYRLARGALVGLSAGVLDGTSAAASDTRLAAYFAAKPWSSVTFDAKAQWGEAQAFDAPGAVTTQSAVSARVTGNFNYLGVKVTPIVSVARGVDEAEAAAGGNAIEKSTVALTPRISQPFVLQGGGRMEPFLSLKSAIDFGDAADGAHHGVDRTTGVGAGLTSAQPNVYSLSVTTGVEQSTSEERPSMSGKFELKVPLK